MLNEEQCTWIALDKKLEVLMTLANVKPTAINSNSAEIDVSY